MSDSSKSTEFKDTLANLRQYIRRRKVVERCELCSVELPDEHQHLVQPENRRIVCSCDPCAILFSNVADSKYRRIPRSAHTLPDFVMTDVMWDGLMIPINMAFFFQCTPAERVVAMYPSPAGATESLLSFDSWSDIVTANSCLEHMSPDVEALLVNRIGRSRGAANSRASENEYFLAPIDQCYKLVGLIRGYWRGLSGGIEVWQHIEAYFEELRSRSSPLVSTLARESGDA